MKEELKEKITGESHGECKRKTRLLRQQKTGSGGRCAALGAHCATAGRGRGPAPGGAATDSAVSPPRTATPPRPAPPATRVRASARPASPPPTKSNLACGRPSIRGAARAGTEGRGGSPGDAGSPSSRGALAPRQSLGQTLFGAASVEGAAQARWEGVRGRRPYLRRRPLRTR